MTPNKIYFPADGLPSYIDWNGSPIRTKQVEDSDVCYILKDALLEWAEGKKKHYMDRQEYDCGWNDLLDELIDKINSL